MRNVSPHSSRADARRAARLPFAAVGLAALCALPGCGKPAGAAPPKPSEGAEAAPVAKGGSNAIAVEVEAVATGEYVRSLTLPGRFAPWKTVRVGVEIPGRVVELGAEEGEEIEADRVLVRLDSTLARASVGQAAAQVAAADVGVKGARIQLDRTEKLAESKIADQARLDGAKIGYEQAKAQRAVAAAAQKAAAAQLDRHTVRAPMAGRVLARRIEKGELASPGMPLFEIVSLQKMKLVVDVPEARITSLEQGRDVMVTVPADDNRALKGKVSRIPAVADSASRTFPVEIEVDNEAGRLRGGMMARARIEVEREEQAVLVRAEAIVDEAGPRADAVVSVAYVAKDGKAERRVVQTGELVPGDGGPRIRVLSGLQAGDKLIVVGQRRVVDGDTVRVVQAKFAAPKPAASESAAAEPAAAEPAAAP